MSNSWLFGINIAINQKKVMDMEYNNAIGTIITGG